MKDVSFKGEIVVKVPEEIILQNTRRFVKQDIRSYWDKDFINQKLSEIQNSADRMLLTFLWFTGVRITEALTLTKGDIDFKNYIMRIKWLKSRKYNERMVPIHPRLRDVLFVYTASLNLADKVFPMSRQRAWQIVRKYFQDGHPHQFRHSFAVNWLRQGGDIVTLHRILGHKNIQATMEYLKIVPKDQAQELFKIDFG